MTTATLAVLMDDYAAEAEISEHGWLYAGRATNLATGESWRYVYRSSVVKTGSAKHQRMLAWLDGAAPIGNVELHDDPEMMYGTGELTLWEA